MPQMPEQMKPDMNDPVVATAIAMHEERKAYNIANGLDPTHPETYGKVPQEAQQDPVVEPVIADTEPTVEAPVLNDDDHAEGEPS